MVSLRTPYSLEWLNFHYAAARDPASGASLPHQPHAFVLHAGTPDELRCLTVLADPARNPVHRRIFCKDVEGSWAEWDWVTGMRMDRIMR